MIIDEDGDKYSFDEFNDLAGETCELTREDEKILWDIGASRDKAEDDRYSMYVAEGAKQMKKAKKKE